MVLAGTSSCRPPARAWGRANCPWGVWSKGVPHPELESPGELMLALGCRRGQGQPWGCWIAPGEGAADYLGVIPRPPTSYQILFFLFLEIVVGWARLREGECWGPSPSVFGELWVGSWSLGGPRRKGDRGEGTSRVGVTLSLLSLAARRAPAHTDASAAWWAKRGRPCPPRAPVAPRTLLRARCPPCPCPGDLLR